MGENLSVEFGTKTILELCSLQTSGHLNLTPGFQRKSVWKPSDRRKLIQSIFERMPVPSIFLHKRIENGQLIYDVLDGKQRLETIFMFSRIRPFMRSGFEAKLHLPADTKAEWYDWQRLEKLE